MRQAWANPSPAGNAYGKTASGLPTGIVWVDSSVAPLQSPAPAPGSKGNPAGIVPQGYVHQIGSDGEVDTMLADARTGSTVYQVNIYSFVVPYITGGWPPDTQAGQPGHGGQLGVGQ